MNLNLIVAKEPIHKGKYVTSRTIIDDLVNERCWVIVLGTRFGQIYMEFSAYMIGSLLFVYWNEVWYSLGQRDRLDEPFFKKLLYFSFDHRGFFRLDNP